MTPEHLERVFGRGRLKMVTGEHVEVFREAVVPGERRRYTKRFLETRQGDFGQWTEREWRILARLIGHGIACVPDVVQYDRGRESGAQLVQTYDAGVTVDQWATLLPVARGGRVYRHVFEDCAHWWALAHHCLAALAEIHPLELVHLDIKGDNVCIPYTPVSFDPDIHDAPLQPVFTQLSLIDFAFALVSRESLTTALPIGWQRDYDYQSPRLLAALEAGHHGDLQATRELDWRCDMYSLAAMLKRYLPDDYVVSPSARTAGWAPERYEAAKKLILRLRDVHDQELPAQRPHAEFIALTGAMLDQEELARSLSQRWTLAREAAVVRVPASPLTPVTLLAPPIRVTRSGRGTAATAVTVVPPGADAEAHAHGQSAERLHDVQAAAATPLEVGAAPGAAALSRSRAVRDERRWATAVTVVALIVVGAALSYGVDRALFAEGEPMETAKQGPRQPPREAQSEAQNPQAEAKGDAAVSPPAAVAAAGEAAGAPADEPATQAAESAVSAATNAEAAATELPAMERDAVPPAESQIPPGTPSRAAPSGRPKQHAPSRSSAKTARPASAPTPPSAGAVAAGSVSAAPSASAVAPARAASATASVPQSRRPLPSWVSLEPPSWLRSGKAPMPPGAAATEGRARIEGSAVEVVRDETPRAAPPPLNSPASANVTTQPLVTEDRRIAAATPPSRRALPGAPSAAPIEERSDPLNVAATNRPAPAQRRAAPAEAPPDFAAQGRRIVEETVPRYASLAEPEVGHVLWLASTAYHPMQDRVVADAARVARVSDDSSLATRAVAPSEARRFNDEAWIAYQSRRNAVEALDLQIQAFGANPRDPEIAGNLALYYLKQRPTQARLARQMALFALAARGPQSSATRIEDWHTLAIASALTGRESDATRALYVTLAMSPSAESRCVAALDALATYGERLRAPVDALFARLRAQGRGYDSPACSWPSNWSVRRLS